MVNVEKGYKAAMVIDIKLFRPRKQGNGKSAKNISGEYFQKTQFVSLFHPPFAGVCAPRRFSPHPKRLSIYLEIVSLTELAVLPILVNLGENDKNECFWPPLDPIKTTFRPAKDWSSQESDAKQLWSSTSSFSGRASRVTAKAQKTYSNLRRFPLEGNPQRRNRLAKFMKMTLNLTLTSKTSFC